MSRQVSRGSAGDYQADEQAGVSRLCCRLPSLFSFPHPEGSHDLSLDQGWGSPPLQTRVLVWTPLATHSLMRKFSIGHKIFDTHLHSTLRIWHLFIYIFDKYIQLYEKHMSLWWKKSDQMRTWTSAVK